MNNIAVENEGGFEAYIAKMNIPGTWGDGVTVSSCVTIQKVD